MRQIGRVPLREQVSNFEKSREYMVRVIGENGTKEMLKNAMFTITIGSNDILNYIQPSIPFFSQDKLPTDVLQDSMVLHLTTHLKVIKNSTLLLYRQKCYKFCYLDKSESNIYYDHLLSSLIHLCPI